jgi:hypothetical protein
LKVIFSLLGVKGQQTVRDFNRREATPLAELVDPTQLPVATRIATLNPAYLAETKWSAGETMAVPISVGGDAISTSGFKDWTRENL